MTRSPWKLLQVTLVTFMGLALLRCSGGGNTPPPEPSLAINAAAGPLTVGATRSFTAVVSNTSNTAVTWSVLEANGGSISTAGLYTAPAAPGTFTVKATLQADPTKSATSPVTVVAAARIVSFTATPPMVFPGQGGSVLAAEFSGGSGSVTPAVGAVLSGQGYPVNPVATTTYTLKVTNAAGDSVSADATVTVETRPPTIESLTVNPAVVPYGQPVQLAWVLGGGLPAELKLNGVSVLGQSGTLVNLTRRAAFTLTASNPLGAATPRTVSAAGMGLESFAGAVMGGRGVEDGRGAAARTDMPDGLAFDAAGNLYVTDWAMHTVRKVAADGTATTLAGHPGEAGTLDGPGPQARFHNPYGIAVDGAGNLWVCDSGNHCIRTITPAGVVSTLAGSKGVPGYQDGPAGSALFRSPAGIAIDPLGNAFIADQGNSVIRRLSSAGTVSTLAGEPGFPGSSNGKGAAAHFNLPLHLVLDAAGNLFLTDSGNSTVRRIAPDGSVSTLAGLAGSPGTADGTGDQARFSFPAGLAIDASANLYVADGGGHTLRKVTPAGVVSTLAGSAGLRGTADGGSSAARFNVPWGLARDAAGNLFVGEDGNHTIRRVAADASVTTFLGRALEFGTADGPAPQARFRSPGPAVVDGNGNVFVPDTLNHTIRRIAADGTVSTFAGTAGKEGSSNGTGTAASFSFPEALAFDSQGNLYVAEDSHIIRRITPAGVVSTFAGAPYVGDFADGPAAGARFYFPAGLAVDAQDNLYVADSGNACIRKITPAGQVSTLAGLGGSPGSDNGSGGSARFGLPWALALAPGGDLIVTDPVNAELRRVTPAGVVSTFAGAAGSPGSTDGPAGSARFRYPFALAVDPQGRAYVSDGRVLRRIAADGSVDTLAGSYTDFSSAAPGPLPGHLGRIWGLGLLGKDLLLATDHGLAILTAPNGE